MAGLQEEITRRRTFAIISHPDAGKTTLTEKFLLYGGAIAQAGEVKGKRARAATSDWMEIEKQRGISVTSSVMQFQHDGYCINILDTPGHQDFSEDTYRTLMAADSAVMVIDGAKGVVLSPDKCIVVRDDALELLEQLRGELPAELKKAQDLIRRRDEYVEEAKKEAERIRRQAELDAKTIVGESEIARVARDKAREMVTQANDRSKAIINVANEYTDDALRRTEEAIQQALEEVRDSRARFRAVSREKLQSQQAQAEEQSRGK